MIQKTELLRALEQHEDSKVREYLQSGGDPNIKLRGYSILIHAIQGGMDKATIRLIVESGANVNDNDNSEGRTPLIEAVFRGYYDHFLVLLEHGADINGTDKGLFTPLMKDAMDGFWSEITDDLLSRGADPHRRNVWGHAAIDIARMNGRHEYAERLKSFMTKQTLF